MSKENPLNVKIKFIFFSHHSDFEVSVLWEEFSMVLDPPRFKFLGRAVKARIKKKQCPKAQFWLTKKGDKNVGTLRI